jgi:hypothetical protein
MRVARYSFDTGRATVGVQKARETSSEYSKPDFRIESKLLKSSELLLPGAGVREVLGH